MKNRVPIITSCLIGAGLLAAAIFMSVEQKTLAQSPADPAYAAHSAHVAADASQPGGQNVEAQLAEILARLQRLEAITQQQPAQQQPGQQRLTQQQPAQQPKQFAQHQPAQHQQFAQQQPGQQQQFAQQQPGQSPSSGGMPMGAGNPPRMKQMPGMGSGANSAPAGGMGRGPAVADQMAELRGKMQRLETTLQQQSGSSSGATPMNSTPGMGSGTSPMQEKMAGMSGMGARSQPSGGAPGAMKPAGGMGGMGGMGGGASGSSGEMGMTGMMDKMKSMMDKMMGGMGGGAMPADAPTERDAPGGKMGMMDMDKMEMAGMMGKMGGTGGKGGSRMTMPSALPGFPGASHLYHVGATDFFLDHPQCITLSTEQQMMLNQIKEQTALDKTSADRSVQEAEQDLWTLTAADQPDNAQIEAKVAEIEKFKGDARLRFIGAIGEAANILNDGQRKSLTGFAPPAPAAPATAPMVGMKGM